MVIYAYNSSTWVKAAMLGVQGHHWLHSVFETSLKYMRLFQKEATFIVCTSE